MKNMLKIARDPSHTLPVNVREAFKKIGYGLTVLQTDRGSCLIISYEGEYIRELERPLTGVKIEYFVEEGCPIIRFEVEVHGKLGDPLKMDCYLNMADSKSGARNIMESLSRQDMMLLVWYDQDLNYVRATGVHWRDEQRVTARMIINESLRLIEETGGGVSVLAKEKYKRVNPLR